MICSWGSASQQVVIRGCIYYVNCKMICSLGTTSQQMVIRGCKHVSCKMICSWRDCTMGPSITAAEMHPAAPHALFRQISSPIRRIPSPDPTGRAALLGHKTQLSTPVIRPEREREREGRQRERERGGGEERQTKRMGDTAAGAKRHPSIRRAQSSVPKGWQEDRLPRNQRRRSPPENEAITASSLRGIRWRLHRAIWPGRQISYEGLWP